MRLFSYVVSLSILVPLGASADAPADEYKLNTQPRAVTSEVNRASDASFDKRLPPVLPGEEVNDSGKKMRVWSTSGGVPVSNAPEPWRESGKLPEGIGVVVDSRAKGRRDRDHDRDKEHEVPKTQGAVPITGDSGGR